MTARPEPTQLEYLADATFLGKLLVFPTADATFLGKLLVFPTNVRPDWKVIASYKHSSLFGLINRDEGKKF